MTASAATSRHAAARARGALLGTIGVLVGILVLVLALAAPCSAAPVVVAQDQPNAPAAPAPATAPGEDNPKSSSQALKNVEPLPLGDAAPLLGKKVKGRSGEDLGLIVDVLVDARGQPRAAVIDFGGFLGVGSRKIAVDWKALDFTPLGRAGTIDLGFGRDQIAAAPEYKPGPAGADVVTPLPALAAPADAHK